MPQQGNTKKNDNFNKARYVASYGTSMQLPASTLPEISFVGRSNVGKSSLLNKLTNRKNLARVSSTPGKTTTINFFDINSAFLVDLPGYGFANRSKSEKTRWQELIEGYFNQDRNFSLIVSLIDIRHNPTELDKSMVAYLHEIGFPFCIALTKADKLSKQKANNQKLAIRKALLLDERVPMIITSSQTGKGINQLKELIQLTV